MIDFLCRDDPEPLKELDRMKLEKFTGKMESAYGNDLPTPLKFSGEFQAYETIEEIRAANDLPSDKEVVTSVNARRKASEVQKARTAALEAAGIKAPTNEDPRTAHKNMVAILVAQGKTEDEAVDLATKVLGHSGQ